VLKDANNAGFSSQIRTEKSTRILSVGIKYSVRDLISDIISVDVREAATWITQVKYDTILIENMKRKRD